MGSEGRAGALLQKGGPFPGVIPWRRVKGWGPGAALPQGVDPSQWPPRALLQQSRKAGFPNPLSR